MVDDGRQREGNKVQYDNGVEHVQEDGAYSIPQGILNPHHVEDNGTVDQGTNTVAY